MTWTWSRWLFGIGISLVVSRALLALLPRVDPCVSVTATIGLLIESTLLALLVLGFATQLAGDQRVMRAEQERIASDLHDGLGPTLASQALSIDTVELLLSRDPAAAAALLREVRAQTHSATSGPDSVGTSTLSPTRGVVSPGSR